MGWRIIKENQRNWLVILGTLAVVLLVGGIWIQDFIPDLVFKVVLMTAFMCALLALPFAMLRVTSRTRKKVDENAPTGLSVNAAGSRDRRGWSLVILLGVLEIPLMYFTGVFGRGPETGWFMAFSLLWFFNTLALGGAVIAQFLPRKTD